MQELWQAPSCLRSSYVQGLQGFSGVWMPSRAQLGGALDIILQVQ